MLIVLERVGSEPMWRHMLGPAMPAPKYSIDDTATALVASHGLGAPQKAIDQIIACIREHDISGAKAWEEVGRKVDEVLLLQGTGRTGAGLSSPSSLS
jgi:hypothetical protein